MKKRKIIALITTNPESVYQQRVMEGVFSQCNRYGYDVAVISTLVQLGHYFKDYLEAEINIYNLLNPNLFDGIIVTPICLSENNKSPVFNIVLNKLKNEYRGKVVALDMPFGDYEVSYTDDTKAFRKITSHILDVHKCQNVYFLTGYKDSDVSTQRLKGFTDELKERGIDVDENKIFYGDFWYSSGELLADRIHSGELEIPEAVICASDHMAIGVANRLTDYGIKVPEQVIVTGYDATQEAVVNRITITSYEPDIFDAAAEAVNSIHKIIEPDIPVQPVSTFKNSGLKIGESCGCKADMNYMKQTLNNSLYNSNHNNKEEDINESYDISRLLESYMHEQLIQTKNPEECLSSIYKRTYLIRPFSDFYLCLKENWLDMNSVCKKGYPSKMKMYIHACREVLDLNDPKLERFNEADTKGERSFDTCLMLPEMFEYRDEPHVFYFSPIHFSDETLGYTVLSCKLSQHHKINYVYRNWIRYVNSALEMIRIRFQLIEYSTQDMATGLYNRRGMYEKLNDMKKFGTGKQILVIMSDMDGLKFINDNYGHNEGDFGIMTIATEMKKACRNNEICVRNGGDEFLIIGVGEYTDDEVMDKINIISNQLKIKTAESKKPYEISSSFGYCFTKLERDTNIDAIISIADKRMYENKRIRKKLRK